MGLEKLGCKPLTVRGGVFRDTKALPEGLGGMGCRQSNGDSIYWHPHSSGIITHCPQGLSVPYIHFLVFTENKGSWPGNLSKPTLNQDQSKTLTKGAMPHLLHIKRRI